MSYDASRQAANHISQLDTSPFVVEFGYYKLHFSTSSHAVKFQENVWKRIEWLNDSLSRRFKCNVDAAHLAVIQLYTQIEGRGFHVVYRGKLYRSASDIDVAVAIVGEF